MDHTSTTMASRDIIIVPPADDTMDNLVVNNVIDSFNHTTTNGNTDADADNENEVTVHVNANEQHYHYPSDEEADDEEDDDDDDDDSSVGSEDTGGSLPPLIRGPFGRPFPALLAAIHADDHDDDDDSIDDGSESSSSTSTGSIPPLIPRGWLDDSSDDDSDVDNLPHLADLGGVRNRNQNNQHYLAGFPFQFWAANRHNFNNNRPNEGPDVTFFREFLNILRSNDCTEMYRYYVSRQERLVSLMLRTPEKADEFLLAAEGNTSLQQLHLDISHRFTDAEMAAENWMGEEEYYRRWRTIGQGVSQLQGLEELQIHAGGYLLQQNAPDFQALTNIMMEGGGAQVKKFVMTCDLLDGDNVEFAQAFRDHAHLEKIEFRGYFEAGPMDAIAQELLTVPKLARIDILNCFSRSIPSRVLPRSLLHLAEKPSIRNLGLQRCIFTEEQCDILSNSLRENTSVEALNFQYSQFQGQGGRKVAASLQYSTKLQKVVYSTKTLDRDICAALGETFRVNSSIQRFQMEAEEEEWAAEEEDFDSSWLDPIFEALQSNTTVNFLQVTELDQWNDTTSDKFRAVLESPTTAVTDLCLKSQGDASYPWQRIVSALRENRTLKTFNLAAAVAHAGVVSTVAVLETNTTLESFEAHPCSRLVCGRCENPFSGTSIYGAKRQKAKICPEDCVSARAVEALGRNCTLKRLMIDTCIAHHTKDVSEEGCKQLVAALKDNFGLEDDDMSWGRQQLYKKTMETIAQLNKAGRRYLLDKMDRESGVRVLGEVSDSLDCLFTHLQENPSLCDFQR